MSSKTEKDKVKQIQDKCQAVLNEMLRDEDNKYCVDCDSKGPRWASWNLGVFLCIRCAGIHRNLGVHISKVKSVNLDAWTPEQVVSLQQMGNSRARAVYEANLPDNFRRPQSDSSLESFVRAKYEHKKYIAREWVPPVIPKVDWEKEIDEEIERQKRKKKAAAASSSAAIDKKPFKIAEVPQIPKPKNSSPKPTRIIEKTTQDLLGIQNGEDGFTGFLSGPSPVQNETVAKIKKEGDSVAAAAAAAKADEESFFNQPAPTEKERTKLTKDSILALYASAPQTQPQPMYTPTSGAFPQQPYAFGVFPQQTQAQSFVPVQNGMALQFQQTTTASGSQFQPFASQNQSTTSPGPQFQQFTSQNQQNASGTQFQQFATQKPQTTASGQFQQFAAQFPMQTGQFMGQTPANSAHHHFAAAGQQFPSLVQFPATSAGVQVPTPTQYAFQPTASAFSSQATVDSAVGAMAPASNPFFGVAGQPFQQQFAGLTLGAQMPAAAKPTPPIATNLWQ